MELINYYNLNDAQHALFVKFLQECHDEVSQPAHENMWDNDWENKPNTLFYILNKTNRYEHNGCYNVLFENNQIIACSGCYTSSFHPKILISGSRTWIHKSHRHRLLAREYLLPFEKKYGISNNYSCIILTFNDYNKNLIHLWVRKRLGESRTIRQPKHFGYNGVNIVDFPVTINYTKQYVIYEILDPSFYFNWQSISIKI